MFSLLSVIEELVYSCKQAQRPLSASKRKTRERSVCVRAGKAVIYGSLWFVSAGFGSWRSEPLRIRGM